MNIIGKALRAALVLIICSAVTASGMMNAGRLCLDHHGEVAPHVHEEVHCHDGSSHASTCGGSCSHGEGLGHEADGETCDCAYGPLGTAAALCNRPLNPRPSQSSQPIESVCDTLQTTSGHSAVTAASGAVGGRLHLSLHDLRTVVLRL